MAITTALSSVFPAGIASWKIKDLTRPDDAYYSLPFLREGKVTIEPLSKPDSYTRPLSYAYEMKASCITPAIRTSANFIKLLDAWRTQKIGHKITLIGGAQVISSEATSMTETGMGSKWTLISEADMDDDMHLLLEVSRKITVAEYNYMLATSGAPADGTPNVADTFYTMNSLAQSDIVPAGISKIEMGVAGYTDTFTHLRNAKFRAEAVTKPDSRGRELVYAVDINVEADVMDGLEADLVQFDAVATRANDVKVTFVNGLVCTMATTLGVLPSYHVESDMDDVSFVKLVCKGRVLTTSWDAFWSA